MFPIQTFQKETFQKDKRPDKEKAVGIKCNYRLTSGTFALNFPTLFVFWVGHSIKSLTLKQIYTLGNQLFFDLRTKTSTLDQL